MSLNAMKCNCGTISVHYLQYDCFQKAIRYLASYIEFTK